MSRLIHRGEVLPDTADLAELYCHIAPPDAPGPRLDWSFSLQHTIERHDPATGRRTHHRNFSVEIDHLHFHEPDWRRFSGLHIRADSAWYDRHEYIDAGSELRRSDMRVWDSASVFNESGKASIESWDRWTGENFILRFGTRDGFDFPFELDVWTVPENEWSRTTPEPEAQASRFPETPPDVRIIASARFEGGLVEVPRCGMDPIPLGRRLIQQAIAFQEPAQIGFNWALQSRTGINDLVRVPGWRSSVFFRTYPAD